MYDTKHNAVLIRRDECSQLFLIFTGILQRVMGLGPLEFIKVAGLQNRNVVIFRDPSKSGFLAGCSDRIKSFEDLLAWQREIVAGLPHVRRVYSIGVSSGALAAMLAVNRLGGECSWVFGPRMLRASATAIELGLAERMIVAGQDWQTRLRDWLHLTARESLPPRSIREGGYADFQRMLSDLEASQTSAVHHLYYVSTNPVDRVTVEYLSHRCKQVQPHGVAPPAGYPRERKRRVGWDHVVIPIMIARGELQSLFPPFDASAG